MIITQLMRAKSHFNQDLHKHSELALPPAAINHTKEAMS
jgi:hypothetical protein